MGGRGEEDGARWDAFHGRGDEEARQALLASHLPLVHHLAKRLARRMGGRLEYEDLVGSGTVGLIAAVEGFDPSRGLAFSTFATPRIAGAMLDHLRRWDHASRGVRRRERRLSAAEQGLSARLGRAPTSPEMAASLGIHTEELAGWRRAARLAEPLSLDAARTGVNGDRTPVAEVLADPQAPDPDERITSLEEMALVRDAILELPERERLVLTLCYFEGLKLREVGEILEVTEARVSQIRSHALKTLRQRLRGLRTAAA